MESVVSQYKNKHEKSKKPLPEVEKAPIYYYEEGIGFFETACRFRQMIAMQHYLGREDYSFYDLVQELLQKSEIIESLNIAS
jgi:hypothetical protein